MSVWTAKAPSNIALIKYMGKKDPEANIPANVSLSYTLAHLISCVEIELLKKGFKDQWEPLCKEGFLEVKLSEKAQRRFLNHFQFLKEALNISGFFSVRSANNFPLSCGLASSASSFAALTLCAHKMASSSLSREKLASLSQRGSGSSCRSFFSPWTLWSEEGLQTLDLPSFHHKVVLLEEGLKEVSSSLAHKRVLTSPLFKGRAQRAKQRLDELLICLKKENGPQTFQIIWDEFWDMHKLFETSTPSFSYISPKTKAFLEFLKHYWEKEGEGPFVTLDAGPQVHLLFPFSFEKKRSSFEQKISQFGVLFPS